MSEWQQVPHNFLICERTDEPCFWPECLARGCAENAVVDTGDELQIAEHLNGWGNKATQQSGLAKHIAQVIRDQPR